MAQPVMSCRVCGDWDVVQLEDGRVRCRTCGVIPATADIGVGRTLGRLVLLIVGVAGAVVIADVLVAASFRTDLPFVVLFSGIWVLILGGIKGGVNRQVGVTTYATEVDSRFSSSGERLTLILMAAGLCLIGLGAVLHILRP